MSECPPVKTEAELEADVDYMIDAIYNEIKSDKLPMSVHEVNMRVREILKKRGMISTKKGGSRSSRKSKKSKSIRKSRRNKSSRKRNKKSTRRRRR